MTCGHGSAHTGEASAKNGLAGSDDGWSLNVHEVAMTGCGVEIEEGVRPVREPEFDLRSVERYQGSEVAAALCLSVISV